MAGKTLTKEDIQEYACKTSYRWYSRRIVEFYAGRSKCIGFLQKWTERYI